MDQAAESVSSFDGVVVCGCYEHEGWSLGSGRLEFEAAVWPVGVVVVDVDAEDVLEVSAAADQDPVEALTSDGPDAALGVSVGPRCPDGRAVDDADSLTVEDLVEGACELAVAVTDQKPDGCGSLAQCPGEVARLLGTSAPGKKQWPDENELIRRTISKVNQFQKNNISQRSENHV